MSVQYHTHRQGCGGWLLVELSLFIGLLAVLIGHGTAIEYRNQEKRDIDYVVGKIDAMTQAALGYWVRFRRFPDNSSVLLIHGGLEEVVRFSYSLRSGGQSIILYQTARSGLFNPYATLTTRLPNNRMALKLARRLGPTARVSDQTLVTLVILAPGFDLSHYGLVRRDGSRMTGTLNMNNKKVRNAAGISLENQLPASGVIDWRNKFGTGQLLVDQIRANRVIYNGFELRNFQGYQAQ